MDPSNTRSTRLKNNFFPKIIYLENKTNFGKNLQQQQSTAGVQVGKISEEKESGIGSHSRK